MRSDAYHVISAIVQAIARRQFVVPGDAERIFSAVAEEEAPSPLTPVFKRGTDGWPLSQPLGDERVGGTLWPRYRLYH